MNNNILERFKNLVLSGEDTNNSIGIGLKMLIENGYANYTILWYRDKNNEEVLYPYYWICPVDLTNVSYTIDNKTVGFCYKNKEIISLNKEDIKDDILLNKFNDNISSIICLPLIVNNKVIGCLEFLNMNKEFSEDNINIFKNIVNVISNVYKESFLLPETNRNKELLLSIKDLYKTYDNGIIKTKVLKGINIDIYKGEFLCILGESGCGKSTLLNIIGGLIDADSGSLLFNNKEILNLNEKELTRHRREYIGYIFQNYNLMPNLTAKQNLDLIAELIDNPASSIEMLKLVGMGEKINSYPSELSGGQQQRVSIARALVKKPILVLADEPTAALDCETSKGVLEVFEDVVSKGQTLIVVTHNEKITKIANRVIRLKEGKIYETIVNLNPMKAIDLEW